MLTGRLSRNLALVGLLPWKLNLDSIREGRIEGMFWFKSCPKCHGDLHRDLDVYGTFITCVQCGRYLTQAEEAQEPMFQDSLVHRQVATVELEPVAA